MSSKTWMGILGVGAVAAGAALYFLAQEEEEIEIKYDPKVHTVEKLLSILEWFEVEYASIYLNWFRMLKRKEKEVGRDQFPPETMIEVKSKIAELTDAVDNEIFEEHKITKKFFDEWVKKYENNGEIRDIVKRLHQNHDRLFRFEQPIFKLNYPKEITKEAYVKYIKIAYAKFRYNMYHEIQNFIRQSGKQPGEEDFNNCITKWNLPEIKIKVYRMLKFPEIPNERPTRTALKAYLSHIQVDEQWHHQIDQIQKEHKQILFSLASGEKVEGMHQDPTEVMMQEENIKNQAKPKFSEPKVIELANSTGSVSQSDAAQPKNAGSFSFLGDKEKQEELVKAFLSRNKKPEEEKKEEVKAEEPLVVPNGVVDEPVEEQPKEDKVDTPKKEAPKEDKTPKKEDTPKKEESTKEEAKVEAPKEEAPKEETPKKEEAKKDNGQKEDVKTLVKDNKEVKITEELPVDKDVVAPSKNDSGKKEDKKGVKK